jgi:hypothetical protein
MKRTLVQLPALLALSLLSSACYTTSVRSGAAPGRTPVGYDDHWHHGFLWGIAEASGPYDIDQICPEGWAEVKTETTFLTGLVEVLALGIYSPQSVTLVCAAGPAPIAPATSTPVVAPTARVRACGSRARDRRPRTAAAGTC